MNRPEAILGFIRESRFRFIQIQVYPMTNPNEIPVTLRSFLELFFYRET